MTCKPRPISGNLPFDAIAKDYNRYCDRIVGNAEEILDREFIINLIESLSTRATETTVFGYAPNSISTDTQVLIAVPDLLPAIKGGRLEDGEWFDYTNESPLNISFWGDSMTTDTFGYGLEVAAIFNDRPFFNGGIISETSTQIKIRMLAATDKYDNTTIIWAGRNNAQAPEQVKTDIAEMVAAVTSGEYLVISIFNADLPDEYAGETKYNTIVQLNAYLATTYGDRFVDLRNYIIAQYNPNLPQDVIDHGRDVPPLSLRDGIIHQNVPGRELSADFVSAIIEAKGWNTVVREPLITSLQNSAGGINKQIQSQNLNNAAWSLSSVGIDSAVEVLGAISLDRINIDASSAAHSAFTAVNFVITSGVNQVVSAHIKDDGQRYCFLTLWGNGTNYVTCVFDLLDGSLVDTSVGGASGTFDYAGFEALEDGLFRVFLVGSIVAVSAKAIIGGAGSATPIYTGGQPSYLAVAGEDLIAGGVQVEESSIISPYAPTTTIPVSFDSDKNKIAVSSKHTTESGAERGQFKPVGAGQVNKYLRSFFIDATHTIDVYLTATQIIAFYIDGANTSSAAFNYTHLADIDFLYDVYWDQALNQLGIRADAVSGDIDSKAFITGTFAGMTALPATSGIGNKNDGDQAQGEFANNGVPINWSSAQSAGFI